MAKMKWQFPPDRISWNRLRSLRESRGLSQAELAVGAGASVSTVYYIENGLEARVKEETKKKISAFFGLDVDDIFPCEFIGDKPLSKYFEDRKIRRGTGCLAEKK